MSKIEEQIKKLREEEERLKRETRKVEFFNHILTSAKEYEHQDFKDVKSDVVALLETFVKKTIEAIEAGSEVTITVGAPVINIVQTTPQAPAQPHVAAPAQLKPPAQIEASPSEKMNFAMEHRHLGGKQVQVENDKNLTIRGKVVGLDAPFVIVQVDGGPAIKVPRDKVALL